MASSRRSRRRQMRFTVKPCARFTFRSDGGQGTSVAQNTFNRLAIMEKLSDR